MGNLLTRICIPLLHWLRLFGYTPYLLYFFYKYPFKISIGLLFYYTILSRLSLWRNFIKKFTEKGFDPRFHIIQHGEFDPTKRYLVCIHPHVSFWYGCVCVWV